MTKRKAPASSKPMFADRAAEDAEVDRVLKSIKDWKPTGGEVNVKPSNPIDPKVYVSDGHGTFDPNGH